MQAGRLGVGAISCTWVILRTEPSQLGPKLPRAEEPWGRPHLKHARLQGSAMSAFSSKGVKEGGASGQGWSLQSGVGPSSGACSSRN